MTYETIGKLRRDGVAIMSIELNTLLRKRERESSDRLGHPRDGWRHSDA